jgi:Putative peptidoglycan binding domain/L,D-transpeptidase catalytic domain
VARLGEDGGVSHPMPPGDERSSTPRAIPIVAAVALLGLVGVVGAIGVATRDDASADAPSTGVAASTAAGASSTTVTTTRPAPTTSTVPKTRIAGPLKRGMSGPEVRALQQRLTKLKFQPGPIDGQFGSLTQMAVWAYQKLVMGVPFDQPDGVVTPDMWLALQDPLRVHARRPQAGKHTEVYLPKQVLVVFNGDTPLFISHMSSGELADPPGNDFNKGKDWCSEVTIDPGEQGNEKGTEPIKTGVCGNAWTPAGVYHFNRKYEGKRESRLGGMQNPVYFNYGIAIHGAYQIPLHPASHGCIRIPNLISPTFFNLVNKGEQVFVFDDVKEPEEYGSPPGFFDRRDPNYTTTTTTTVPPVTAAPTTAKPAPPPVKTPPATTTTSTTTTLPAATSTTG